MAEGYQGKQGSSSNRGFAGMDKNNQQDTAGKHGTASHSKTTAHKLDAEKAPETGMKGEQAGGRNKGSQQKGL